MSLKYYWRYLLDYLYFTSSIFDSFCATTFQKKRCTFYSHTFSLTPKSTCYILMAQTGQQFTHRQYNKLSSLTASDLADTLNTNTVFVKYGSVGVCLTVHKNMEKLVRLLCLIAGILWSLYFYFGILLEYFFHHCTLVYLKPETSRTLLK
jgi:hypothetical protein